MYSSIWYWLVIVVLVILVGGLLRQNARLRATFKVERRIAKLNARMKNPGNRLYNYLTEITKGKGFKITRRIEDAEETIFGSIRTPRYFIFVSSLSTNEEFFHVCLYVSETPWCNRIFINEQMNGTIGDFDLNDLEHAVTGAKVLLASNVEKYQEIRADVVA